MMVIDNKFEIGQLVYLNTDKEQSRRLIIGILIRPTGIIYEVSLGHETSQHYEMEISAEENLELKVK